jgi:hypothetical protein
MRQRWAMRSGEERMAGKGGLGSGVWLIGGLVLLVAMCRGGGDRTTQAETAPTVAVVPAAITAPEPLAEPMHVAVGTLNQRSSPNGAVVGKLSGGDPVSVYEHSGNWARISPNGATPRWVSPRLLCSGGGCYQPAQPRQRSASPPARRIRSDYIDNDCPCSGNHVCIGPRGGRYCITSGGNKRYGV